MIGRENPDTQLLNHKYKCIVDSTCFVPRKNRRKSKHFWFWYKSKTICVLYFRFVPSPEIFSLAPIFSKGQSKWNQLYPFF